MDKRGEGVRIILDNSRRLSGRIPDYRMIRDAELMLTIYGHRFHEGRVMSPWSPKAQNTVVESLADSIAGAARCHSNNQKEEAGLRHPLLVLEKSMLAEAREMTELNRPSQYPTPDQRTTQ